MTAHAIVNRLLEQGDEFDARAYVAKTPHEEFDEGAEDILKDARQLYARLQRENVLQVATERKRGSLVDPDASAVAQAVLLLALEKRGSPGARRIFLRLKRYGRYLI